MLSEALIYLGATAVVLLLLVVLFLIEDIQGKKVFLSRLRGGLDAILHKINNSVGFNSPFFSKGVFRLVMHYVTHTFLGTVLHFLRRVEKRIERIAHRNKKAAREIVSEKQIKNHLDEIAEHKTETALSEKEKEQRRAQ